MPKSVPGAINRPEVLPVGDGEMDIDEAGSRDRDIGDVRILLEPGDDLSAKRARIGAERLGQHHGGIGRDIAMAGVTRRLDGDAAEIERSLFPDEINLSRAFLIRSFEVGEEVHACFSCEFVPNGAVRA